MKSEKQIEQSLVKAVKNMGGIAPKFVSPGFDGIIFFLFLTAVRTIVQI